jgi:hypothetical protein
VYQVKEYTEACSAFPRNTDLILRHTCQRADRDASWTRFGIRIRRGDVSPVVLTVRSVRRRRRRMLPEGTGQEVHVRTPGSAVPDGAVPSTRVCTRTTHGVRARRGRRAGGHDKMDKTGLLGMLGTSEDTGNAHCDRARRESRSSLSSSLSSSSKRRSSGIKR